MVATMRPDTCTGLSAAYAAANITIEGNENYLIAEGLCSEFWNTVVFRDPVARLVSHLNYYWQFAEESGYGMADWIQPEKITSPEVVFETIPVLSNNYYIR